MKPQKTISIITPSYGQMDWLRLCIASVADQVGTQCEGGNVKGVKVGEDRSQRSDDGSQRSEVSNHQLSISPPLHVEHIIQDGGTPGIEDFAREVGAEFYRDGVLVFSARPSTLDQGPYRLAIYSEPDAGMYDAINKGIAKISGEFWAWLNSDEQYLPGTLAYVAEWFATHPNTEILCGDALLTDRRGKALSYRRIIVPDWRHTRLVHLATLSCASFYRRSIVDKVGGFDTAWRSIGDAEWMARMIRRGIKIHACGKLLSTFAFTGQNTSESPKAAEEGSIWRNAKDAPPTWQTLPVIAIHRFRKFLNGAYRRRSAVYAVHTEAKVGRVTRATKRLGWGWPSSDATDRKMDDTLERVNQFFYTTPVLGTELLVTDYEGLSSALLKTVDGAGTDSERALAVDFANTQIVTMRRHEPDFAKLSQCMAWTLPDGMPLVWAMNKKGAGLEDRVYGPTFTREFLASCPGGRTHYLVGGSEECGRRFKERMLELNPALQFVGGYHGRCSVDGVLEDDAAVLADILEKKPDFIWVGLGTPKQYGWIARIKPKLRRGVLLAVGFAFDVNAGMKADAPLWMQRLGLTWLFRMASEPGRLIRRYFKWNTLFLSYTAGDALAPKIRRAKLMFRGWVLKLADVFSSEIKDCVTGENLGRALLLSWGTHPWVIGHKGLPPLIPRFLPQKRLTYWWQAIGFTTHPRPDYPRLLETSTKGASGRRVLNLVLTHLGNKALPKLLKNWEGVCGQEDLWIAFGGTRQDFDDLDYTRKVFVEDSGLRRADNQREKQSYTGIFHAIAPVIESEKPDYVYLCEYDQLPLVPDLNDRQVEEILSEGADMMGHWLYRVDGSSHFHTLYHETDAAFLSYWKSISRREDPGVVLSMFGSGSFWTRECFLAVAGRKQQIPCYLELYLPTLVHHLGFRVRGWKEQNHLISNLPEHGVTEDAARRANCWTVHPVKG